MNEITKAAVAEATRLHPSMSKKAADAEPGSYWGIQFGYKVMSAWGDIILGNISWHLRIRAEHLFKLKRPDLFDEEGTLDEYLDFTCFVPMVERVVETYLDNHPETELQDYAKYLKILHPKQLRLELF